MHAVAIDFETANEQRASPCSIGLAWINDGVIESVEHHYIRPPGMRFASFNIAFHGIGPEQVEDAEEFPAVLAAIAPRLEGRTVLAHNRLRRQRHPQHLRPLRPDLSRVRLPLHRQAGPDQLARVSLAQAEQRLR